MTTPSPERERTTRVRRVKAAGSSQVTASAKRSQPKKRAQRSQEKPAGAGARAGERSSSAPPDAPPAASDAPAAAERAPGENTPPAPTPARRGPDDEVVLEETWLECMCLEALARAMQREFEFLAPGRNPEERRAGDRLYALLLLVVQRAEAALMAIEGCLTEAAGEPEE